MAPEVIETQDKVVEKPVVVEEKKPFFAPKTEKVEEKPEAPKPVAADSNEAGLQSIRQAINLIKSHSGTAIGGSMLHEAVELLESGYGVIYANDPKAEAKKDEPSKPFWPAKA
jgi:hypothetical protein